MRKTKNKRIISAILSIVIILGCAAGAVAIFGNKYKDIYPTFTAGSLSATSGEYVESETSLYTKNLVECKGITITPDFESDSTYQIFWYNRDGKFIGSENVTDGAFDGKTPTIAKYCRIVLTPDLTDELKEDKDFKFNLFNTSKYADDINVKVYRDQTFNPEDFFATAQKNSAFGVTGAGAGAINSNITFIKNVTIDGYVDATEKQLKPYSTALVNKSIDGYDADEFNGYGVIKLYAENVSAYEFRFGKIPENMKYFVFFYRSDGTAVTPAEQILPESNSAYVIDVPAEADYVCINVYPEDMEDGGDVVPFVINEYMWRTYSAQ